MNSWFKILLILYFTIGLLVYLVIGLLAGGLGIISLGGPAGDALEFIITVLAWPLVILLSVMVLIQGR